MFIAPVSADPLSVLKPDTVDHLGDRSAKDVTSPNALPKSWTLISGGQSALYPDVSLRYVHVDTQKIGGRIYLLAQPTNGAENRRPSRRAAGAGVSERLSISACRAEFLTQAANMPLSYSRAAVPCCGDAVVRTSIE